MIVVIGILCILLGIAVLKIGPIDYNAKYIAKESSIRIVEGSAATYHSQIGKFPDHIGELIPDYLESNPFIEPDITVTFDENGKIDVEVNMP